MKFLTVQYPQGNKVKTMSFSESKLEHFLKTVNPKWYKIIEQK